MAGWGELPWGPTLWFCNEEIDGGFYFQGRPLPAPEIDADPKRGRRGQEQLKNLCSVTINRLIWWDFWDGLVI